MNWFDREEGRYVEYGTSFSASRTFGFKRSLTDTIYNMNAEHLSADVADGLRGARRRRRPHRGHDVPDVPRPPRARAGGATPRSRGWPTQVFRKPVLGPREFFYADLFASRRTGCRAQLGLPGVRDRHSGCVGAHLVEHDLFDFLLLSLPDNDTHSHRNGPFAQVPSIAEADRQLERLMHAGGGPGRLPRGARGDRLLRPLAVEGRGRDRPVRRLRRLRGAAARRARKPDARGDRPVPGVALGAGLRARPRAARPSSSRALEATALALEGVDVGDAPDGPSRTARRSCGRPAGELRFAPGGALTDLRGRALEPRGRAGRARARGRGRRRHARRPIPDALGRIWAALRCRTSGELLLSAAPGYEFLDWGGAHHVGGGSHGSLHANDSHGALIWCGTGPDAVDARPQWALRDITPMVLEHFGVAGR